MLIKMKTLIYATPAVNRLTLKPPVPFIVVFSFVINIINTSKRSIFFKVDEMN